MKKGKRSIAALLASIVTAGTVSATSAGAICIANDSSQMESMLKLYTRVPADSSLFIKNDKDLFINNDDSSLAYFNKTTSNWIGLQIDADTDLENVEKKILEIIPQAQISSNNTTNDESESAYVINIYGYQGSLSYDESKEKNITFEEAKKLRSSLSEIAKVNHFNFEEELYTGFFAEGFITGYRLEEKENLEDYIAQNDMKCHVGSYEEMYSYIYNTEYVYDSINDDMCYVIPDEKLSSLELYDIADKIYSETGVCPWLSYPETMAVPENEVVDMANNISGDANDDKKLGVADVITIMQSIADPDNNQLTLQELYNADITGDGDGITAEDALAVKMKLIELG